MKRIKQMRPKDTKTNRKKETIKKMKHEKKITENKTAFAIGQKQREMLVGGRS